MLPGKGAAVLPKHCDIALRAVAQDARLLWKFAYQCRNSDEAYTTKDRNNVCADAAPMNLAEIMRLSGYEVPRVLQWQESVVAKLSEKLLGKSADEIREVLRAARPTIEKKYTTNRLHIAWTFRDAIDRATLMQTRPDPLTDLGI